MQRTPKRGQLHFVVLPIRSDREEEGIVQHQHDHAGSYEREHDAAGPESAALVFDELEAHDKDQNGDGCKGNRHADNGNPVQNFKQCCQGDKASFMVIHGWIYYGQSSALTIR